jgi:hypothetical protein
MHVIGHEAVRKYCRARVGCGSHELRMDNGDTVCGNEQSASFVSAKRKEVSMKTQVVERLQMLWSPSEHAPPIAI